MSNAIHGLWLFPWLTGESTGVYPPPVYPTAFWDGESKTLEVRVLDVPSSAHPIHEQPLCDLRVANDDGEGDCIDGYTLSGFTIRATEGLLRYIKETKQKQCGPRLYRWGLRLYPAYRWLWNTFRGKVRVSYMIAHVEKDFPDIFGKYRDELWAMIRHRDLKNLKIHIPLP